MATSFNSFNRSPLGAFIRSPLGVRGGVGGLVPLDVAYLYSDISYAADVLYGGDAGDTTNLQTYVCIRFGDKTPATPSNQHGKVNVATFNPEDGEPVADESLHYFPGKGAFQWNPGDSLNDGRLSPFGFPSIAHACYPGRDTTERPQYNLAAGYWLAQANRAQAPPPCAGSGWYTPPGAPPNTLYYATGSAVLTWSHRVLKRATAQDAFAWIGLPTDTPATMWPTEISEHTARIYAKNGSGQLEWWPIEGAYAGNSTTITLPASTVKVWRLWKDWLIVWANSGNIYCYWKDSLVRTLVYQTDTPNTINAVLLGNALLAITDTNDAVRFWRIEDDGTMEDLGTYTGTVRNVGPVGRTLAVSDDYDLLRYVDGAWVAAGEIADAKDLVDNEGYWRQSFCDGWILLMNNGSSTPYYYLVRAE